MVATRERETVSLALVLDDAFALPSRRDSLPENTRYADTGCSVHPSCLTCPLVRCRYDEPGGVRALLSVDRDAAILRLRRAGTLTAEQIAARLGISRRTVFRVLARVRDEEEGRGA